MQIDKTDTGEFVLQSSDGCVMLSPTSWDDDGCCIELFWGGSVIATLWPDRNSPLCEVAQLEMYRDQLMGANLPQRQKEVAA